MKRWSAVAGTAVLAPVLGVGLSACSAFSDDTAAQDGKLTVVAGLYPLQWVSQQVAGSEVEVVNLTQPGQEPHDLELSPAQTGQVADADLVIYEAGFQPVVDDAVKNVMTGTPLDVTEAAHLVPASDLADVEDHGADPEEAQEHAELGNQDPHFWQDPERMADVADEVATKLSEIDPDNADTYRANAEKLIDRLEKLDRAYAEGLSGCWRDTIVVSHDAFGYLHKYGLTIEPVAGISPEAEPTPADLARLQDLIDEQGLTTIFVERLSPPELTKSLAEDTVATTAVLDPIEGLTAETAEEDYLSLMRQNLAALETANGCR